MVRKILICGMCFMLLLGVSVSAEREMPQGNPESFTEMPQGTPPEGMELPESAAPPQGMPENREGFPGGEQGQNRQGQNAQQMTPPNMDFGGGNMPGGFDRNNMQLDTESMTFMGFVKEYQTPIISVVLLLFAFVFVKLYKRKNY